MNEKLKRVWLFIGVTYALSWLIIVLFLALGGKCGTPQAMAAVTAFMFMPMTSAILIQRFIYKGSLRKPLGVSFKLNWWWLVAWLLPPVIALATMGVSLLIPGVAYSPEMTGFLERLGGAVPPEQIQRMREQMAALPIHIFWIALVQGLIAGVTVNAVAGFGEELGWRGFLLRELGHMGFWRASVLIGLIWGMWHAPIILQGHNYPQHPVGGVFMMVLFCILLSPIFTYIRVKSGSVIAAAILHGSLNATAGLAIMMVEGGDDLTIGVTGLAGFITLLIVNLLIFLCDNSIRGKPLNVVEGI